MSIDEKIELYNDVMLIAKYVNELKEATELIKEEYQNEIDYLNKYDFYLELGRKFIKLQELNGDILENV